MATEPLGDAVAADACGHAQVQRLGKQAMDGLGHFLEQLRFDRPDHELCARQAAVGAGHGMHAQGVVQVLAGRLKGLDHMDGRRRDALLAQARDQGGGHVAATNEHDGQQ